MGNAESFTISSKNCNNQVNLVKLQKNKSDNTLTLDIISANCHSAPSRRHQTQKNQLDLAGETPKDIFKFSFVHQLSESTPLDTPFVCNNSVIDGIRFIGLIWVFLVNVVTALSYASSEIFKYIYSLIDFQQKYIFQTTKNIWNQIIGSSTSFSRTPLFLMILGFSSVVF
jgi:hypothetical protein